jgi:formate dehydrogenase subunit gamma
MLDSAGPFRPRLDDIIAAHLALEGPLLPILHAVQAEWGYVPEAAHGVIAQALNVTRAEVYGVVTFYHDFRAAPPPAHVVKVCRAEACQAQGGRALEAGLAALAGPDVAVEAIYCLGLCACGPAVMVDGVLIGRATVEAVAAKVAS